MNNIEKVDTDDLVDSKLPYGNELKNLLKQPQITEAYIASTLKKKGIFYGKREKSDTIPVLCSTLLSPQEFQEIREHQQTKESNYKKKSTLIKWKSSSDLMSVMPEIDTNQVCQTEYYNYEICGQPTFFPQNGDTNSLEFAYEIVRYDLDETCYSNTKKVFPANIRIEKRDNFLDIKVTSNFTSKETEDVNAKIVAHVKQALMSGGHIEESEEKLTFDSFNNEERISFFWSLTGSINSDFLKFKKITDIDIKPDDSVEIPKNINIDWMAKKISRMHISGEEIHQTLFITDKKCHPYLIIWNMQAGFDFSNHSAEGSCRVTFEFTNYSRSNNKKSEFSISVDSINLQKKYKHINQVALKKEILEILDVMKIDKFKNFLDKPKSK